MNNNETIEDLEEEINNLKEEIKEIKMQMNIHRQFDNKSDFTSHHTDLPSQSANHADFFRNIGTNIAKLVLEEKYDGRKMAYKLASNYIQNAFKEGNYIGELFSIESKENISLKEKSSKTMMINWEV